MNKSSAIILTLVVCVPSLGSGQEFGKLFTTQEERDYLDYLREEFLASNAETGFNVDSNAVPEIPDQEEESQEIVEFHFGGIMSRRDGGRAVWLNGKSILENSLPENMTIVTTDGSAALRLETAETRFILKPGQTVNTSTGEFWEAFERPARLISDPEIIDSEIPDSEISLDLPEVVSSVPSDLSAETDRPPLPPEILELISNADD